MATTLSRPTIVFFAGAFAEPSCFDRIATQFQSSGFSTVYATVPSLNPSALSSVSCSKDASEARNNTLLPLIDEQHKDVIIFTHSYGGVVGGAAAAGLSKVTRISRNQKGGVIGLVYLVGNIVSEGETLLQAVGGAYPPFIKEGNVSCTISRFCSQGRCS
jgi:pimeloyl-ACP methyl ester carboxylesterase